MARVFPVKMVLSLIALGGVSWLATNAHVYNDYLRGIYFSLTLISVTVIHLRLHADRRDILGVLAGGAALALIDFKVFHFALSAFGVLSFLGIASFSAIALRAIWQKGASKERLALAFVSTLLVFSNSWPLFNLWTEKLNPKVLDLYLYSFDASLRVQLSFLMGQVYAVWHRFGDLGMFFYLGIPITGALVFAGQLVRDQQKAIRAMTAFLIAGPLGVIFYNLYPALGPAHVFFERWPWYPLTLDQASRLRLEPVALVGLRNAMPSLHMTWVLLAWWYSRGLSIWERSAAICFVIFTAFSTLGTGEHYLIDLVVAFPFALFTYGLSTLDLRWRDPQRVAAIVRGLGLTLLWIAALRFGVKGFWVSPIVPWVACVSTVGYTIFFQKRLCQASEKSIQAVSVATCDASLAVS
jgi:hypothetical protein